MREAMRGPDRSEGDKGGERRHQGSEGGEYSYAGGEYSYAGGEGGEGR